ncbi:ABC transporter transmembrane domain-containing protein [Ilyomonas limi]|nr:ABC transporter transmembrane domain-containing protein [Ilyomonas limi]
MPVKSDQQLKYNDCGISVIKSIFNYYHVNIDRDYIAATVPLDANGAWLQDIKSFFEQHCFKADYNFLDLNALKFNTKKIEAFLPCILPVKNARGLHYVVIYGTEEKKLLVLDPAEANRMKWSVAEFMQRAYTNTAYYDKLSSKEVLQQLIKDELDLYDLQPNSITQQDETIVANKLTYFSYLKENFGFASKDAEVSFLKDLLYNLQLNTLPNEFKSLQAADDKISVRTPVVLTVKLIDNKTYKQQFTSKKASENNNAYIQLFREMKQHKKLWYIYIFAALFAAFMTQMLVFSSQLLIDNILPSYDTSLVILFAVGLGLFKLFELTIRVYKSFISIQLSNIFDSHFLTSFVRKLNSYPIRYIHAFNRGDLTERMKDSLMLKTFFTRFFTSILTDSIISVYSLIILFIINWQISLIILAIIILFIIWFKVITPRIRENEKRRFMQKSGLFSNVLENIDGLQVIKSFNIEYLFQQRMQPAIAGMMKVQKKVRYISLLNSSVIDLLIIIASVLILAFLSVSSVNNQSVSVGQIITFIALSGRIFNSLTSIMDENLDLQENEIILKRYLDFDATKADVNNEINMEQEDKIKDFRLKNIQFKNVGFEYVPQKPVLKNFNLRITDGEKIRLEGSNGAGKSTFCKILSMLYTPTAGNVYINNEKAIFYNQAALRKKILLISNDDILFNDTLSFNIKFNRSVDVLKILMLSRQIGFHDFISKNAEGFDYVITEGGRNLSTGQRKKVLLLRALLSDAELIIIDEVLSGIDKESKEKIEAFINQDSTRAFIIISHEPVDNIRFDKAIMLTNGSVVENIYITNKRFMKNDH